jgi:hypothetical protein
MCEQRELKVNVKFVIVQCFAVVLLVIEATADSKEGNENTADLFVFI